MKKTALVDKRILHYMSVMSPMPSRESDALSRRTSGTSKIPQSGAMSGASFFQQLYPGTTAQSLYNQLPRQKTSQSLSVCHEYDQTDARNHDLICPKPASSNGR